MLKKAFAFCLLFAILASSLTGCENKAKAVYTLGTYTISEEEYKYWISYYKTTFFDTFAEAGYVDGDEYSEEFWKTVSEGETLEAITRKQVDERIKNLLVGKMLFDEYKLGQTEGVLEQIDSAVKVSIDEDVASCGNRKALNAALGKYGLNINKLEKIYENEYKYILLVDYLYGDEGVEKITEQEVEEYYQETYYRIKHILIDISDQYVKDGEGNMVIDTSTGYYKTEPLTDEEKAQKKTLADKVFALAKDTTTEEEFEDLIEEYNEDEWPKYYPDGYFITTQDYYEEDYLNTVVEMQIGEVRMVESTYGYYITKKYPLETGGYAKEENEDFFSDIYDVVSSIKEEEKMSSYYSQITVDEAVYSAIDFSKIGLMATGLLGED